MIIAIFASNAVNGDSFWWHSRRWNIIPSLDNGMIGGCRKEFTAVKEHENVRNKGLRREIHIGQRCWNFQIFMMISNYH